MAALVPWTAACEPRPLKPSRSLLTVPATGRTSTTTIDGHAATLPLLPVYAA